MILYYGNKLPSLLNISLKGEAMELDRTQGTVPGRELVGPHNHTHFHTRMKSYSRYFCLTTSVVFS